MEFDNGLPSLLSGKSLILWIGTSVKKRMDVPIVNARMKKSFVSLSDILPDAIARKPSKNLQWGVLRPSSTKPSQPLNHL